MLTDNFYKEIDPEKDSIVYFDSTLYCNFKIGQIEEVKWLTLDYYDTLYLGEKMSGCFYSSIEKVMIFRNKTANTKSYKVVYEKDGNNSRTQTNNITDSTIKKTFKNFIDDCMALNKQTENGLYSFSTNSKRIYIRKKNIIYELPDIGGINWKGYDSFKMKMGISY